MRTVLSVAALLLAIASSARAQPDASPSPDAMPEVVVQRFVDAANARNANAWRRWSLRMPCSQAFLAGRSSPRTVTVPGALFAATAVSAARLSYHSAATHRRRADRHRPRAFQGDASRAKSGDLDVSRT